MMKLLCSAYHRGEFSHTIDFSLHRPVVNSELEARKLMDKWNAAVIKPGTWVYINLITERRCAPRRGNKGDRRA